MAIVSVMVTWLSPSTAAYAAAAAEEARIWRAAVVDQQAKTIQVWDLGEREKVTVFETASPARLNPGTSTMQFISVEGVSGQIRPFDLGLKQENHGDHKDWVAGKPALGDALFVGKRPSHVVANVDKVAVFFDGEGMVRIPINKTMAQTYSAEKPHHGIAIPMPNNQVLVSMPAAEGNLPKGMRLATSEDKTIAQSPVCERQHGYGQYGDHYIFGCANGLLVFDNKTQSFELINYPQGSGERLVRSMVSTPLKANFVANFGPDGLLLINLTQRKLTPIQLPNKLLGFTWDSAEAQHVFVLLDTGEIARLNAQTGAISQTKQMIPAWKAPAEGEPKLPVPQIAVASSRLVISDPRTGLLQFVQTSDLKELDRIEVGGQPSYLVLRSVNLDAD